MDEDTTRPRRGGCLAVGCVSPIVLYALAYVVARLSHQLVYYGSFVGRPNAMHGIGYSWAELIFFPLIWLEQTIR